MASFNKVILMGNLTRDPELRYTPKGTTIAKIGLAVNRVWTNEAGRKRKTSLLLTWMFLAARRKTSVNICAKAVRFWLKAVSSWINGTTRPLAPNAASSVLLRKRFNFSAARPALAKVVHRQLHARRVRLQVRPQANPSKATRHPKATTFRSDFLIRK